MTTLQIVISTILSILVLVGISMMSRVQTAVRGNLLSALAMLVGVVATLLFSHTLSAWVVYPAILVGALIGGTMAVRVKMIQMPQTVALFNGLGGGASALVGCLSSLGIGFSAEQLSEIAALGYMPFVQVSSLLAVAVGMITLVGSLVAAGKLHRLLPQKPMVCHNAQVHSLLTSVVLFFLLWCIIDPLLGTTEIEGMAPAVVFTLVSASLFGLLFSIRVGGADMPITISLLNSLSGVAGAIAGMAISNVFLVAVGGIVGASGLLLTQIMCRAMNRSLVNILIPKPASHSAASAVSSPSSSTSTSSSTASALPSSVGDNDALIKRVMDLEKKIRELEEIVKNLESRVQTLTAQVDTVEARETGKEQPATDSEPSQPTAASVLAAAKDVIIVPGYGMALAQAQHLVKQLADRLEARGARVRYAIHPVAGRMPGHMNVLLAEANVDYDVLFEMEAINDDFAKTDAVVVIGANDVMNPAARNAEGTPIYGMPVLNVDAAPEVIVCNYDLKPGYAGVDNPIYSREKGVFLELGDAKETLARLIAALN